MENPKGLKEFDDFSDGERESLYSPFDDEADLTQRTAQETKGWNLFREIPIKKESGSMASVTWIEQSIKLMKLLAYIIVFFLVLGSAVIGKGTLLFITSQLKKGRKITHCNRRLQLDQQFVTELGLEERVAWLWAILIVFSIPEVGTFLRSIRICFFKTSPKPTRFQFGIALVTETLYTLGMAALLLIILPELDVVKGAMLMNAMCFVPAVLNIVTRDPTDMRYAVKLILDIVAVSAQATAFFVWPLLNGNNNLWWISFASICVSFGWWENFINYVDKDSPDALRFLKSLRVNLKKTRYYTQAYLTIWKIVLFATCIMVSLYIQDDDAYSFFTSAGEAFSTKNYTVDEIRVIISNLDDGTIGYNMSETEFILESDWGTPLWVALIQVGTAYSCFACAKFACKILIQNVSFTFALSLVGPLTINLLIVLCAFRNADPCAFHGIIPDYLFFEIPPVYHLAEYLTREMAWIWLFWIASQLWITVHCWSPRCERLASFDKLFTRPWYSGPLVDQSLLLNRNKDDETYVTIEDLKEVQGKDTDSVRSSNSTKDIRPSDTVTRLYICATMWHETKEEMIEFLKSIFRMDEDQCARRIAQKYLGVVNADYYEMEIHIFMDDAFVSTKASGEDAQVNRWVQCLIDTVDEAASEVHITNVRLRPPKKYPTPYGGRLVWTLPGKNKMICHLKDKAKIRHKKRWSQVMYMYYFLGHRLMDVPISVDRKEVISENTYLLALDGDIDFKPSAVTLLVDLMKKDKNLGAACGRIHPVGSGFMAWYQNFEYAVGHWLQKATEHVIGCVLCSPGCFSLFRGKALMDDNVMRKYTLTSHEARHFVQYDQGEDRWLCTLLLQRGYRVEYSAASDAYTHCPELFNEFFNQRRRWVPSTMANIFDLLASSRYTVSVNDNISKLYITYQILLMLGTVLGPGTIFLMLVGAMNAILGVSIGTALLWNLIPVAAFITVCMTCKSEVQLLFAVAITCLYAMLMAMVIVGLVLQIIEDGWLAPSSMFTVLTFGIYFITAALHPQELYCLAYLGIYYITIPSMYMLLIIYSLCNLNNVSWGTREVVAPKTAKELEEEEKEAEESKQKMEAAGLRKMFGGNKTNETEGSLEFGIAGLCKCMWCTNPKDYKDDMHLLQIVNSIEKIEKKLETLGAKEPEPVRGSMRRRSSAVFTTATNESIALSETSSTTEDVPTEERFDLVNPYWIEDPNLRKGEVDFLTTAEIDFWKELIDTYLKPIDEDKKKKELIEQELKNLRDTVIFAFVMLNALFVVVIFLMQLNQDVLHIKWPLGQKNNVTYDDDINIVYIGQEYLMLEPIGSVFLIFFGMVMSIQFTAMIFHRAGTLMHLLSTTSLNWFWTKKTDEVSTNAIIDSSAVQLVKELQRLNMDDIEKTDKDDKVSRRKTIHNIEKRRETRSNVVNLDANFKRRLTILQNGDNDMISRLSTFGNNQAARRTTLRAIQMRRDSVVAERRRSQMFPRSSNNFLSNDLDEMRPSTSGYVGQGYEPELNLEEESPRPRRTTIRFRPKDDRRQSSAGYANQGYELSPDFEDYAPQPRRSNVRFRPNVSEL